MKTTEQLRELLALADKATPGKREIVPDEGCYDIYSNDGIDLCIAMGVREKDAEFIARCSPDAIREIVQGLIAARAEIKRVEDSICPACSRTSLRKVETGFWRCGAPACGIGLER